MCSDIIRKFIRLEINILQQHVNIMSYYLFITCISFCLLFRIDSMENLVILMFSAPL